MRITTGMVGGREIFVPKSDLRPTQDKVRQALFSSLGDGIAGARFLDLFAGSGSVGLEAWSRGAEFVCFVEQDPRAVEAIHRNVEVLSIPKLAVQILKSDAEKFLARPVAMQPFDVVFADPPYLKKWGMRNVECGKKDKLKQGRPTKEDPRAGLQRPWAEKVLSLVAASPILRGGGLLIFEQGEDEPAFESPGWEMIRERCYGAARLVFYRKQKPETEV